MTLPRNVTTKVIDPSQIPTETIFEKTVLQRYYQKVKTLKKTPDDQDTFCACLPLTKLEEKKCKMQARADTLKDFKEVAPKKEDADVDIWNNTFEDHYVCWVLFTCMRMPDNLDDKFFLTKDQILNDYTPAQLAYLYGQYAITVAQQNVYQEIDFSDPNAYSAVMDKIINQSTVEETAFFLNGYTAVNVAQLIRSISADLIRLLNANGSVGTPSSDTKQSDNLQT
jgi:hypothetical protein